MLLLRLLIKDTPAFTLAALSLADHFLREPSAKVPSTLRQPSAGETCGEEMSLVSPETHKELRSANNHGT